MNKKLKVVLIVLFMILIILIGFGGIYAKKLVLFENIIPDYELGTNLEGSALTTIIVDTSSKEVIYDKDGNVVEKIPDGEDESNYTKEQVLINDEESKTVKNYKASKEIMINRLNSLGVSDYEIRLDEETGAMAINLADSNTTNTVVSQLLQTGKFEIIDTDTKEVLMNNDDLKEVSVLYNQDTSGVTVYLSMEFTSEGRKKLEQITNTYTEVEGEETSSEDTETTEETTEKTITMNVDDEEFLSTAFGEPITNGKITISIGSATTNSETFNSNVATARQYAALFNNGKLPLSYTVEANEYIPSIFANMKYQYIFIALIIALVVISIAYILIRYKKLGLISSLVYVATIALFLIIIRYTRTEIYLEVISPIIVLVLLNTIINCRVLSKLNKEDTCEERAFKIKREFVKIFDLVIIALIPAIVLTYNTSVTIASTGMTLFWGIMCIILMNGIFTRKLLEISVNNKK